MADAAGAMIADDLPAIEQAAVRGWPALHAQDIDGWLARWSSGGSVRANSVAALAFHGADLDSSIARVVAFYRGKGGTPMFTISDASAPSGLDEALAARGWERHGEHVTMAKDVAREAVPPADVLLEPAPGPSWRATYMQGLSESRRGIAEQLVAGTPEPRTFVSCVRGGRVVASGLTIHDGIHASVQCMATEVGARRTGAASAVLAAIEAVAARSGMRRLYLQTDADNAAAIGLYRRFGFQVAGRYHTRTLSR